MEINFSNTTPATPASAVAPAPADASAAAPTSATPPAPAAAPSAAVAVRPASAVGVTSGLILGDKIPSFRDIILPRINLCQNIGELKETFTPGMVVLGRTTIVFSPPVPARPARPAIGNQPEVPAVAEVPASPPARIVVLGFRPTRFSEKVSGGVQGLTVDTEAQVAANGGTLDYKEHELKKAAGMKLFQPLADAVVLVERPETSADDDTVFSFECEGNKYALALWALKGSAYTEAAKRVFFTGRTVGILKKGGYPSYKFTLATREKAYPNGNKAWIPICLPAGKTSEEFLNFVRSLLNAPESESAQ